MGRYYFDLRDQQFAVCDTMGEECATRRPRASVHP